MVFDEIELAELASEQIVNRIAHDTLKLIKKRLIEVQGQRSSHETRVDWALNPSEVAAGPFIKASKTSQSQAITARPESRTLPLYEEAKRQLGIDPNLSLAVEMKKFFDSIDHQVARACGIEKHVLEGKEPKKKKKKSKKLLFNGNCS
jgi:hypothetical protein